MVGILPAAASVIAALFMPLLWQKIAIVGGVLLLGCYMHWVLIRIVKK